MPARGPFPPGRGTSNWARSPEQEEVPLTEESADPPAHTWENPTLGHKIPVFETLSCFCPSLYMLVN